MAITADQLRAKIADLEARIAELDADARLARRELMLYREELHLRDHPVSTTFYGTMEASPVKTPHSPERKRALAKALNQHHANPFVKAVMTDERWGAVSLWAQDHCRHCRARADFHAGRDHTFEAIPLVTVASWYATSKTGRRSIPGAWADVIAAEFMDEKTKKSAVPATDRCWPNGIS